MAAHHFQEIYLWIFSISTCLIASYAFSLTNSTALPIQVSTMTPQIIHSNLTSSNRESRDIQCLPVRQTFAARGLDGTQVPRRAINGDHLKVCSQEMTCCTQEMEYKLGIFAKQDFDRMLHDYISRFKALMISRTTRFDDFFSEVMRSARANLNEMFIKTYGVIYQDNAAVFSELFDDLERYYRGNSRANHVDLQVSMTRFFRTLYQKMFTLLNVQYSFEPTYLLCVGKSIDTIKPFGDVADKLTQHIKRALVDARTFVQALAIGRDTARTALEITLTPHCTAALTRMMYCPHCRGLSNVKPCSAYCLSVVKSCLSQHIQLDVEWNQYIDALLLMADRLKGPFNIETVVVPLDVKISEAIMNLQEKAANISEKVFSECGRPKLAKRALPLALPRPRSPAAPPPPPPPQTAATLEQLTRDVRERLGPTRDLWSALPSQLCAEYGNKFKDPSQEDCWNGLAKSKKLASASEMASSTASKLVKSSEPTENSLHFNLAVGQQIQQLKAATATLKQAYNGNEVEWIESVPDGDDEDLSPDDEHRDGIYDGSGSGETGKNPDDLDVDGSGSGPSTTPLTVSMPSVTQEIQVHPRVSLTTRSPDLYFDTSSTAATTESTTTTEKPTTTRRPSTKVSQRSSGSSTSFSLVLLVLGVIFAFRQF